MAQQLTTEQFNRCEDIGAIITRRQWKHSTKAITELLIAKSEDKEKIITKVENLLNTILDEPNFVRYIRMLSNNTIHNIREENFLNLVDMEAYRRNCAFFMNCGEGREIYTKDIDGEDISGWLIPIEQIDEFIVELSKVPVGSVRAAYVNECWNDYYCWAVWKEIDNIISIDFDFFD